MANKQDEPPKKRVKDLQDKLDQWAKERAKDVPDVVKELKSTLEVSGKEENKLSAFDQTFIKKSSDIPDDLKKLIGAYPDKTLRQPTDSVSQPTSRATGKAAEKKDTPKPQMSNTSPSVNEQKSNMVEQEIVNLKKELEEEKLKFKDQKHIADRRLFEIEEFKMYTLEMKKEMKLKEGEVLYFYERDNESQTLAKTLSSKITKLWTQSGSGNDKTKQKEPDLITMLDELENRIQEYKAAFDKSQNNASDTQRMHEMGSDEVTSNVTDVCAFCATNGKLNPALYFCKDCCTFGRYICGICKRSHDLFINNHNVARIP